MKAANSNTQAFSWTTCFQAQLVSGLSSSLPPGVSLCKASPTSNQQPSLQRESGALFLFFPTADPTSWLFYFPADGSLAPSGEWLIAAHEPPVHPQLPACRSDPQTCSNACRRPDGSDPRQGLVWPREPFASPASDAARTLIGTASAIGSLPIDLTFSQPLESFPRHPVFVIRTGCFSLLTRHALYRSPRQPPSDVFCYAPAAGGTRSEPSASLLQQRGSAWRQQQQQGGGPSVCGGADRTTRKAASGAADVDSGRWRLGGGGARSVRAELAAGEPHVLHHPNPGSGEIHAGGGIQTHAPRGVGAGGEVRKSGLGLGFGSPGSAQ